MAMLRNEREARIRAPGVGGKTGAYKVCWSERELREGKPNVDNGVGRRQLMGFIQLYSVALYAYEA